jgi:hypothetical protein
MLQLASAKVVEPVVNPPIPPFSATRHIELLVGPQTVELSPACRTPRIVVWPYTVTLPQRKLRPVDGNEEVVVVSRSGQVPQDTARELV